jgi:hypothetical protein
MVVVEIGDVLVTRGALIVQPDEYRSGEKVEVNILDPLPTPVEVGDCVSIAGSVRRFACGPACDAAGFVADTLEVR